MNTHFNHERILIKTKFDQCKLLLSRFKTVVLQFVITPLSTYNCSYVINKVYINLSTLSVEQKQLVYEYATLGVDTQLYRT